MFKHSRKKYAIFSCKQLLGALPFSIIVPFLHLKVFLVWLFYLFYIYPMYRVATPLPYGLCLLNICLLLNKKPIGVNALPLYVFKIPLARWSELNLNVRLIHFSFDNILGARMKHCYPLIVSRGTWGIQTLWCGHGHFVPWLGFVCMLLHRLFWWHWGSVLEIHRYMSENVLPMLFPSWMTCASRKMLQPSKRLASVVSLSVWYLILPLS